MTLVEVTLQYFNGSPYRRALERQLRQAWRQLGLPDSMIMLKRVGTPKDAERLAFCGSPTVLIDGVDPCANRRCRSDWPAGSIGLRKGVLVRQRCLSWSRYSKLDPEPISGERTAQPPTAT